MSRRIYVCGNYDRGYCNWMEPTDIVDCVEDCDLMVLTGGSDVDPSFYGRKAHRTTSSYPKRDIYEMGEYRKAVELGKAVIGICRGSQAAMVFNGGRLIQNLHHPYKHEIVTNDGRRYVTSSTHHQLADITSIDPAKVELMAWAEHLSPYAYGEGDDDLIEHEKEAEIVMYKSTKTLGIQGHPESQFSIHGGNDEDARFIDYCRELIDRYLNV